MAARREIVGQVGVAIVPDGSDFGPQLQKLLNGASQTATQAGNTLGSSVATSISSAIGAANPAISSLGENLANAAKAGAIGFGLLAASIKGIEFAAKKVVGSLGNIFDVTQKARIGFTALLGDAGKAETLLQQVITLATASPFETEPLIKYSQQLLGVGFAAEKIVPTLTKVGDLVSALGGDTQTVDGVLRALTQIQTVGRLTGQDALQLQGQLVPITQLLADSLGKTTADIKKMQEQGKITAVQVFDAIDLAGGKYAGAMDNAVKTVVGAFSVLNDTFAGLKRDSPILQRLYIDSVEAIKAIANFAGSDDVRSSLLAIGEAGERVYEKIIPTLEALGSLSAQTTLTSLKATAAVMTAIATALDQIPEPVLTLLIQGFLAKKTIDSVARLAGLSQRFLPLIDNLKKTATGFGGVTKAVEASDQAVQKSSKSFALYAAQAASAVAIVAGSKLSQSNNQNTKDAGNILQAAGAGAALGSSFGPYGAAVGAGGGALIGTLAAVFGRAEKEAKRHRAAMAELGKLTAEGFLNNYTSGLTPGGSVQVIQGRLKEINTAIEAGELQAAQERAKALVERNKIELAVDPSDASPDDRKAQEEFDRLQNIIDNRKFDDTKLREELKALQKNLDEQYSAVVRGYNKILAVASSQGTAINEALYKTIGGPPSAGDGAAGTVAVGIARAEEALKKYGLTLEDIANDPNKSQEIIRIVDLLPELWSRARTAAVKYNDALTIGKTTAATLFGPQQSKAQTQISLLNAESAAVSALIAAEKDRGNGLLQLQSQLAQSQFAEAAYAAGFAPNSSDVEGRAAAEAAYASVLAASAQAAANANLLAAATTDERTGALLRLAGAVDSVENRQIAISVITQGVEEAIAKLAALDEIASGVGGGGGINENLYNARRKSIDKVLNGDYTDTTINAVRKAIGSGGGGGGGGAGAVGKSAAETFAEKLAQAGDSLAASIGQAMQASEQAAESWKANIKSSIQYEQAISASRILKNTNRQISDLSAVSAGIGTLKARGLSEAAIQALDINSITDARQVKKLLNADPSQLAQISAAVANRDAAAGKISADRTREESKRTITDAIVAAAKILGYKIDANQAASVLADITINEATDPAAVADSILSSLSGARLSR